MNKKRMHWSLLFEHLPKVFPVLFTLCIILAPNIISGFLANDFRIDNIIVILPFPHKWIPFIGLGIFVLLILFPYIRWRNTYISIEADALVIESGKVNQQKSTLRFESVATIQIKRTFFQMLVGASQLKIDLHSNGSEKAQTPLKKIVLSESDCQYIHDVALGMERRLEETSDAFHFGFGSVLVHSILDNSIALILFSIVMFFAEFLESGGSFDKESLSFIGFFGVAIFIVGSLFSIIKKILSFGNFKIHRRYGSIIIEHGLTTQSIYELPLERITSVTIKQSFLARLFRQYCIQITNSGLGDEGDKEINYLSMYTSKDKTFVILNALLPEFASTQNPVKQPAKALLLSLPSAIVFTVLLLIAAHFITVWLLIALPVFLVLRILNHFTRTLSTNKNQLCVGSSLLGHNLTIILIDRIEKFEITQPLFARVFKLSTLKVSCVGDMNGISAYGYFPNEMIDSFIEHALHEEL